MKKLYKVLNEDLTSPFKSFQFELGKDYYCDDFDESNEECSAGFYATKNVKFISVGTSDIVIS